MTEENFGSVVGVMRVSNDDEAIVEWMTKFLMQKRTKTT